MGVHLIAPEPWVAEDIRPQTTWTGGEFAERLTGGVLLALSSPVIALSALAMAITYKRFPLVAHRRVGRGHLDFWMLKLRTMEPAANSRPRGARWIERIVASPGPGPKRRDDPRVRSALAAFLRRHSIDELPQLWHVVTGEMSLVGPRPLTRHEIDVYYADLSGELLSAKPGLTGLWQVEGRSELAMEERVPLDLKLVRNRSWKLRAKVLARTAAVVITGQGAW